MLSLDTGVNIYVRKWRLLLVLNLTITGNKHIKVKKNIFKISAQFLKLPKNTV